MSGSIPTEGATDEERSVDHEGLNWFNLSSLHILLLNDNQFTGTIPSEMFEANTGKLIK